MEMCKTEKCRKPMKAGNYCYSCVIRRFAERHPEKYCYFVLKNNARARKKEFTITFEYFLKIEIRYEYFKGKGRSATSLHMDRKREELGYVPGNIQVMQNGDNVRKYMSWQYDEKGKPYQFRYYKKTKTNEETSYPF